MLTIIIQMGVPNPGSDQVFLSCFLLLKHPPYINRDRKMIVRSFVNLIAAATLIYLLQREFCFHCFPFKQMQKNLQPKTWRQSF